MHEGDITTFPWRRDQSIEILFIDVAKSWETNDFLLHQFFPQLTVGLVRHPAGLPLAAHAVDLHHDGTAEGVVHAPRVDAVGDVVLPLRPRRSIATCLPASLRDLGAPRLRRLADRAQVFERGGREWTAQQCNIVSLCLSLGDVDEAARVMDETRCRTAPTWVDYFQVPAEHSRPRLRSAEDTEDAHLMPSRICIVAPEFIGPFPNGGVGTACYWEAITLGASATTSPCSTRVRSSVETPEHWERHFASTAPFRYTDLSAWMAHHPSLVVNQRDPMCPESRIADQVLAYLRQEPFDLVLFQEFLGHGARAIQAQEAGLRPDRRAHGDDAALVPAVDLRRHAAIADERGRSSRSIFSRRNPPSAPIACWRRPAHMAHWARVHWHLTQSIDVVPYCYDETLARPREVVEHAGPFRHLVFFGRLETRKGLQLFCRALVTLAASRPQPRARDVPRQAVERGGIAERRVHPANAGAVPGLAWEIKGDLGSLEALDWLSSQRDVLVVAPSLVDNLPYSLIELHCRRIPFVSTHIGGIPEIVGEANRHLLADGDRGWCAARARTRVPRGPSHR